MSKQSARRARARQRAIEASTVNTSAEIALACPLEIAAAATDGDNKQGPRRFTMAAYNGGPVRVNCYDTPVVVDIQGIRIPRKTMPAYYGHDRERIVGHTDQHDKTDGRRFVAAGAISGATEFARQVLESHDAGFPWQASISAMPDDGHLTELAAGQSLEVNGRTIKGPAIIAHKSTLRHIAFVPEGADDTTHVSIAAEAAQFPKKECDMEFTKWVQALGFEMSALTDAQVAALKTKYEAEVQAAAKKSDGKPGEAGGHAQPTGAPKPTFDLSAVVLSHEKYLAAIQAETAAYTGKIEAGKLNGLAHDAGLKAAELKAKALSEEWPATRLEIEAIKAHSEYKVALIQAARPEGPAIHASSRDMVPGVVECAIARTAGLREPEKHYKPEIMEAADKFRALGIQETLLMFAAQNGYHGRAKITEGNLREVLMAAFPARPISAAPSAHTVTTLLTSAGNKFLLEGFNQVPQTWREVGTTRSVTDFKQVTAYRLTTGMEYEELPNGGEIKHGTAGQESYTFQAKTYAKMFGLTRQDIINDDLGAFDDLRSRLGMGAVIAMNKRFWTVWLAAVNAGTFWTTARGNKQEGAATALGETSLNTAVKLFRDMTGPDGNLIGLEPDRMLVPSALEATARKLYVSQEMRDTTASTKTMTSNIYFNRFRPVIVPELGNSNYTGYSATGWWLAANPAILASAAMCFLNGQQTPTIESSDADFNTLGIDFRGYHDFGVSMTEYRASVLSDGTN